MPKKENEELISIKKHTKKEKKPKPPKEKKRAEKTEKVKKKKKTPKMNSVPRSDGVKLDFTREEPRVNRYYIGISKGFRAAKVISVVLLAAFLLIMLVFYRDSITYENLVYLARDLDTEVSAGTVVYNNISYDESYEADFEMFRQRIAVAKPTGFTLYSRGGGVDLNEEITVSNPMLCTGEQYALLYDAGHFAYSMYTSIGRVQSAESEFEIEDACISDSGTYALMTRNNESRFLITVYNEDFKELGKYYKDKLVLDISLDSEGKYLGAVSADVDASGITMQVSMVKAGTEESVSLEYEGMMPIACEYSESGKLFVLCDSALLVFDNEKETARVDFGGLTPGMFDISGDIAVISFAKNAIGTQNELKVFDTQGNMLYNIGINGKIVCVRADSTDAAYAVCEQKAVRLGLGDGKVSEEEIKVKVIDALAVPGSLILCTPGTTVSAFIHD